MTEEEKKKEQNEERILRAGLAGAQSEVVQRYGSAIKEHLVAYSGVDRETGQTLAKGLKKIADSKVNPNDSARNIKQQAGFSAEVKTQARENAEKIIHGDNTSRTVRTDDMVKQSDGKGHTVGGKNEQLYDIADVDQNGNYIKDSGRQLKFVGEDAEGCYRKLLGKDYDKYRNADVPIEVPSDFYDDVKRKLEAREQQLKKQISEAKKNGNTELAQKQQEQLERVEKTKNSLRKGKLTSKEAVKARLHPKLSTIEETVKTAHQGGMEAAKYGTAIGGSVSIVKNLVAVIRDEKEPESAVLDVAKETASSAVVSYGTGFAGSTVKAFMQNAGSKTLQTLSKTNLPGTLVTVAVGATSTMKKYFKGEINGVECFEELGEQGTGMILSALFSVIGKNVIGGAIGGLVGGMLGYAVASASYGILVNALKEADFAAKERARIEQACEEQIRLIREYRDEMERTISKYLLSNATIFHNAFSEMKSALEIGNVDGVISASNQVTEALGKKVLFKDMDGFEKLMCGSDPIRL